MNPTRRPVTSLTDGELAIVEAKVRELLGERLLRFAESRGISLHDTLRFSLLARQCSAARSKRGLTIKEVAATLKVPQYRLRDIESGSPGKVEPEVLGRYLAFLGLRSAASRWVRQNVALAERLGLKPASLSHQASHRGESNESTAGSRVTRYPRRSGSKRRRAKR